MNYLAHALLSDDFSELLYGNFIGDFVRGNKLIEHPILVQKGIRLHREIDKFTDHHPQIKIGKTRLFGKYRHYAGVIIDMYYDHLLANNWGRYSANISLEDFTLKLYPALNVFESLFPPPMKKMLPKMATGNWLLHYKSFEGLSVAMYGMSKRARFDSKMEDAVTDLRENYQLYDHEFNLFFPEIIKFVSDWKREYLQ